MRHSGTIWDLYIGFKQIARHPTAFTPPNDHLTPLRKGLQSSWHGSRGRCCGRQKAASTSSWRSADQGDFPVAKLADPLAFWDSRKVHGFTLESGTPAYTGSLPMVSYLISDVFPSSELGVLARFLPQQRRMQNEEAELKPQASSIDPCASSARTAWEGSWCCPWKKTKNVGGNISLLVRGLLSICDV